MKYSHYKNNTTGRDFVIGDIHGQFWKVEKALADVSFNASEDRLFSVGDLVDRGPESEIILDWLRRPYFFPVIGNHEQILIKYFENNRNISFKTMVDNGAAWFMYMPKSEQLQYIDYFLELPLAIDVELKSGGLAGIVHAASPFSNWTEFTSKICNFDLICNETCYALWNEDRYKFSQSDIVSGVKHVFVGHRPIDIPHVKGEFGNVIYVDNYGWLDKRAFILYDLESGDAIFDNN